MNGNKFLLILLFGALMFAAGALVDSNEVNRKYGIPFFYRPYPQQPCVIQPQGKP